MLKEKEIYVLDIIDMNSFGNGVAKYENAVVFVSGAVVGETVKAQITKVNKNYSFAVVKEIIKPSEKRIEVSCPYFEKCGGCAFLHTDIETENKIKKESVRHAFKKVGIDVEVEETTCPVCEKYRNKTVLFYSDGGFGYKMKSSDKVVLHDKCNMYSEIFDEIASFTANELKERHVRALFLRKSDTSGQISVCPIFRIRPDKNVMKAYSEKLIKRFSSVVSVSYSQNADKDFALENCIFENVYGDGYIEDELCGLEFRVSSKSFYQVNHACAEKLYGKAVELVNANENMKIADLFCGTGTIGIIIANKTGAKVVGVEIEKDAVKDARNNAEINGVKNIEFFEGDAKDFNEKVDVCVIDPPRKGCSQFTVETLLRLAPEKIVYVSCNPETMARDVSLLSEKYKVSSPAYPFNMFPRTEHIETVLRLERTD